uniref:Uncharacterized protein n=1 Tax=Caenorhabditis tropicalis TaxID=1561998 RepID=A0A1I7V3I6_9PELO
MYSRHSISDAYGQIVMPSDEALTVSSSQNSQIDAFAASVDRERDSLRSSGSGNIFKDNGSIKRQSDNGYSSNAAFINDTFEPTPAERCSRSKLD